MCNTKTITRTIAVPVAEVIDGTKSEFYAELRSSLDLSRRVANKVASLCFGSDAELMTGGKCPKFYSYPMVSSEFPGVTSIASSICRKAEAEYKQDRWQVARGMRSVRNYRSFPWPLLHNKSTKAMRVHFGNEELITVDMKLTTRWWTVRLANGSNHRRQNAALRKAIKIGDSRIRIDRKHRAILEVSVELQVEQKKDLRGSLMVSSSRERLLSISTEGSDHLLAINGDQIKQWQHSSRVRNQRLRQDRRTGSRRRKIRDEMNRLRGKNERRMRASCHEFASRIISLARRWNKSEIVLDFTIKSYVDHFPWHDLKQKITYRAEQLGITVHDSTAESIEPDLKKPHVYFKLSPLTHRVKIGMTTQANGKRHKNNTDEPEEMIILAIDCHAKSKLKAKENHFHAMFSDHRMKGEWFQMEPIVAWLREAQWLGNAGNLSQITQVLDASNDAPRVGPLRADRQVLNGACHEAVLAKCDATGDDRTGYGAAVAVDERTGGH